MIITRDIATKVLETVDAGLCYGKGQPIPGKMCIEAAVCYAMGLPHGDEPSCVSSAIRAFKIRLNDSLWSTNQARASGMRRLALVQLGSDGVVDDKEFAKRLGDLAIRKIVPFALREAARTHPDQVHKAALEQAAKDCENKGTIAAAYAAKAALEQAAKDCENTIAAAYAAAAANAAAKAAEAAAYAAEAAYAAAAAAYAAEAAAYAANAVAYAAKAAAKAAEAAAYAAEAAAYAANAAAYAANAAAKAARDKFLALVAEEVAQILVSMNAPGAQWLVLAPILEAA